MKRIVSFLATLCLFQSSHAATAVPDAISYQGRALTATGTLMGAGTPVNRTVLVRIWDHPSNSLTANLIYSEQQVVTIAEGEFSVLVGTGAATANTPLGYSETTKGPPALKISDAFGGENRYLGVTIDDGTAAVDNEISPRQQIVSGAFALRSKFAESIGSASDLTLTPLSGTASNYGLGWYGTGRLFGTAAVDGPVLYGNSGGALGSNVSGSQKLALIWDASGRVGIGTTSITSATNKLTLQGDMATTPADQLTIRGNADNNERLLLGYDTTANKASLQSYSALSTTAPLLLNPSGGNVGVNNTGPSVALDVTGAIKSSTTIAAGNGITGYSVSAGNGGMNSAGDITAGGVVSTGRITANSNITAGGNIIVSGNVGIGTTTPSAPLHVNGGALNSTSLEAYLDQAGANNVSFIVTHPYSIIASSRVRGLAFDVHSDRRIKNSQKLSVGREDLATLMKIEITDYLYKDTVAKGTRPQKKVIAQQVEAVYSQAITQSTEAIPDLYLKATVKDGWVELATDLKKGERVKLIGGKEESVHEVLEVGDGKFRTDFKADGEVFVYGREVDDFRSVDYDAISMLNVSATQQLKREKDAEIQTLRDENAALRRELAAKDASLEARLIALERRISAEGATETVSLKTAQAVK